MQSRLGLGIQNCPINLLHCEDLQERESSDLHQKPRLSAMVYIAQHIAFLDRIFLLHPFTIPSNSLYKAFKVSFNTRISPSPGDSGKEIQMLTLFVLSVLTGVLGSRRFPARNLPPTEHPTGDRTSHNLLICCLDKN
ncbi:unnamed protein product [Victoria cruziana]